MTIRAATAQDLPAILALAGSVDPAAQWSSAHYGRIFSAPGCVAFVAESLEDGITGFIVASTLAPDWEIENVVVAPHHRRKGLGAALLAAVIQCSRSAHAGNIHLEVRASNSAALRLYATAGFRQTGRRPGYYSSPEEDALLLSLPLT